MIPLADVRDLAELPFDSQSKITGICGLERPDLVRQQFDKSGLWWVAPFEYGGADPLRQLRGDACSWPNTSFCNNAPKAPPPP